MWAERQKGLHVVPALNPELKVRGVDLDLS